jgi:hypothetical protein
MLLVALIVDGGAFRFTPAGTVLRRLPDTPLNDTPRLVARPCIWIIGLVAMVILAMMNFQGMPLVSIHIQFALLLISFVGVPWGLMGSGSRRSVWGWSHVVLLGIFLLGFAVRLHELGDAIPFFINEINFTFHLNILRYDGGLRPLLLPLRSVTAFPWLYPYLQWWTADGMLGRTLEGLRLTSVFFGTLTIPALYLLARQLVDQSTALLAATLVGVWFDGRCTSDTILFCKFGAVV